MTTPLAGSAGDENDDVSNSSCMSRSHTELLLPDFFTALQASPQNLHFEVISPLALQYTHLIGGQKNWG